jgi:TusA-related sulfurtransferase
MATHVDARGLSCPQPVILAKQAITAGAFPIEILVDTVTSRENVRRLAERMGLSVAVKDAGGSFALTLAEAK